MGKPISFLQSTPSPDQSSPNSLYSVCRGKPYSNYKPGQTSLDRDYYKDATQEQPSGNVNLQNYQRFGSDYNKGVSSAVKPGDYVVPSKDANPLVEYELMNNPKLFAYTRRAGYDANKTS